MRKMNKTAFTLVELIVVITILAILATVAFISFGGQTSKAKNAKVTSNLSSLASKVNVMTLNSDKTIKSFASGSLTNNWVTGTGAWIAIVAATQSPIGTYNVSTINFFELQEKQENFQDTSWETPKDYLYAFVANSSTAVFNLAGQTTNPDGTYTTVIKGSYFKAAASDVESLISDDSASTTGVSNNQSLATGVKLY